MVWTKGEVDKYVIQVERNCASAHEVSKSYLLFALIHFRAVFSQLSFEEFTVSMTCLTAQLEGICLCQTL